MGDLGKIIVATGFEQLPKVQYMPNLVTLKPMLKPLTPASLTLFVNCCPLKYLFYNFYVLSYAIVGGQFDKCSAIVNY